MLPTVLRNDDFLKKVGVFPVVFGDNYDNILKLNVFNRFWIYLATIQFYEKTRVTKYFMFLLSFY